MCGLVEEVRQLQGLVARPLPDTPHHLRQPNGRPLGPQGRAAPAPPRTHRFRPGHLLDRQLPPPGMPVRSRLPLPAFGRGVDLRLRRDDKQTFYGRLKGHLRICWPGVIVEADLAPATAAICGWPKNCSKGPKEGLWAIGTTWSLLLREELKEGGLDLLAPYKSRKKEKEP